MSTEPVLMAIEIGENITAGMPKNMVPDPGWFDGDRTKFEDWWRGIRLFLKSNRVIESDPSSPQRRHGRDIRTEKAR